MTTFELQDEVQALQDVSTYSIPNEHDISSMDAYSVNALLEGAVESVANSSDDITEPEVFDIYRSLLKHADSLPGQAMNKLLDSISSGFAAQADAAHAFSEEDPQGAVAHKMPLEMYAFLLQWFVSAAEKVKVSEDDDATPAPPTKGRRGRGGKAAAGRGAAKQKKTAWTWEKAIPGTLALISRVLRIKSQRIWTTTAERDEFIKCLTRPAYHISESETYMKSNDIKMGVFKVICLAVKHHGHTLGAQSSIMQSIQYYEHLSEPLADCLSILSKEFDHNQLGDEILREIASKHFDAQDAKGPRAFSRFLMRFAENAPRAVLKQISLLLNHLDSPSYPMRMAMIEVMGSLIRELAVSTDLAADVQTSQKQIGGLYDLLIERTLDLSTYVRAKVLQVFGRLLDLPVKFPKQRLAVTRAATAALEDKTSSVRKAAIGLMVRLIVTHPYGLMHGGLLQLGEWEERYRKVLEELKTMEGKVGKVVEKEDGEEDEEEDEGKNGRDEEEEDEDAEEAPRRKSKKSKRSNEDGDEMDVSEEDENVKDEEEDADMDDNTSAAPKKTKNKKSRRKSEIDMAALGDEQAALAALESDQLVSLRLRKKYYAEALNFIRQVESSMETLGKLLGSTNKFEVLEAMEFFRVAFEYSFDSAEAGIKKMLHLIWQKDNNATNEDGKEVKGVRARLLECYRSIYFDVMPEMDPKQNINRIARNLIQLTYDTTLAGLTSLEEMLRSMMDDSDYKIHQDVINKLWMVYSSDKQLPKQQRRGAIIILGMLALSKRTVVTDNVDTLLRIGLGPFGKSDLVLAKYTCVALQRLNGSAKKIKGSLTNNTVRYDMDNSIFRKLRDTLEHPCRSKEWFPLAEQAINTVYALGDHPDVWCDALIKNLTRRAFEPRPAATPPPTEPKDTDVMDEDRVNPDASQMQDPDATQADAKPKQGAPGQDTGDAFELSQLLFVVGHVAIKHIAYLELVEREWKRQKDEKLATEKTAGGAARASKDGEELDQVAGNAEDEIGDRIGHVREHELLFGADSLLAVFGPMLVHICGSPQIFRNPTLRAAAILAFSKFLCVSSQFCDEHHLLLFKLLDTAKDANIRANIVIALGDVAVSFGTIVDENSNELYKGLGDKNLVVKKNTLMVLTHLILNGMIKVKGQLGEMAKCLEDPEERIADLAKLFFTELSTKDNAIYNNLPDVISHLSVGDHAVDEDTFQSTMRYIFKFIEKERQAENIVEKLCQRFRLSEDPRQWRDIAFCLALLPYKSERSMKKLIDGLQYYRDKLHEQEVFDRFQEILVKARANKSATKPDAELNEFEGILEEHKQQGEDDAALEKRAVNKKAQAKRRATRRTAGRKKAPVQDSSEEE